MTESDPPTPDLTPDATADPAALTPPTRVYRHRLPVRLWHWLNAVALIGLAMSGLMIFNAHPHLYWGQHGADPDTPWLSITGDGPSGAVHIGAVSVPTGNVLGRSRGSDGRLHQRAFPEWMTVPGPYDLAGGRHFHLFFAWLFGLGFLLFIPWALLTRHATRDLAPTLAELSPRHLWHEVRDHARLRFPTGLAAARFNTLQKLSYVAVIFGMIPTMILSGLTMSPTMVTAWPWLIDLFGGRASARSVHFIICWALIAFLIVHLIMVVLAGPINELRSMITGWFRLPPDRPGPVPVTEDAA